ncbi:hypothetical protein HYV57_01345 [Candidatus Peregrinibacteria bacterium]|nr:hypothetical protein [Candidatus Peregrinibacteria bacterium]
MTHAKCNYWKCSNAIGLFLVILFVLCFAWYFIRPVEQELHLQLFRMSIVGFEEMNAIGFILGAIQSYILGYLGVGIWTLVGCCMKSGESHGSCCDGK